MTSICRRFECAPAEWPVCADSQGEFVALAVVTTLSWNGEIFKKSKEDMMF